MNPNESAATPWAFAKAAVRGWDRFWFRPADPTVLGMVRILVGLVALYVHISYTFDLLDFVGPDGWINSKAFKTYRNRLPTYARSKNWSEATVGINVQGPLGPNEQPYTKE